MSAQAQVKDVPGKAVLLSQHLLQEIFEEHGDQFLKFHFLPFLCYQERTALRVSCKAIQNSIPPPNWSYFQTKITLGLTHFPRAFARLEKNTGAVEARGSRRLGGDLSPVKTDLQSNVINIFSTGYSFAVLKSNGKIVTWGHPDYGGDSSSVAHDLKSEEIAKVVSTELAYAVLTQNGKIIAWGDSDFSKYKDQLQSNVVNLEVDDNTGFVANKSNGTEIRWY